MFHQHWFQWRWLHFGVFSAVLGFSASFRLFSVTYPFHQTQRSKIWRWWKFFSNEFQNFLTLKNSCVKISETDWIVNLFTQLVMNSVNNNVKTWTITNYRAPTNTRLYKYLKKYTGTSSNNYWILNPKGKTYLISNFYLELYNCRDE